MEIDSDSDFDSDSGSDLSTAEEACEDSSDEDENGISDTSEPEDESDSDQDEPSLGEDEEGEGETAPSTITDLLISNLLSRPLDTTNGDLIQPSKGCKRRKRKRVTRQPYIEMNLGLGVLEEIKPSEDEDDKEANDRKELISRILELRRLQEGAGEEVDEESSPKGQETNGYDLTSNLKGLHSAGKEAKKVIIEELE
ncbi:hypothetical protein ABW19_dt0202341 [Dactylella cylindrospora]|nr:hypothetical protein ABW19_dt0202341 [Dactylella cylindrospora]